MVWGMHGRGCYMILVTLHSWVPLKGGQVRSIPH